MEMNNYAEIAFNDFNNNVRSIFYDIHKNKLIWKDTNLLAHVIILWWCFKKYADIK